MNNCAGVSLRGETAQWRELRRISDTALAGITGPNQLPYLKYHTINARHLPVPVDSIQVGLALEAFDDFLGQVFAGVRVILRRRRYRSMLTFERRFQVHRVLALMGAKQGGAILGARKSFDDV